MSNRGELSIIAALKGSLLKAVEVANSLLNDVSEKEYSAKWDTKYINDLPNAAFAVIEKGYTEGKDKRARHLP